MSNRRFIQFPHPGSEHRPERGIASKKWNPTSRSHARKFMQLRGSYLKNKRVKTGLVWAWAEWEPESDLSKQLQQPSADYPRYLWDPFWVAKDKYDDLHNTDPYIFGGFYYTDCKQGATRSLEGLRNLESGSLIVFGAYKKSGWVLDTVFVIRDFRDHDQNNYKNALRGLIPSAYQEVTLNPTYEGPYRSRPRRLYIGATPNMALDGMFSFFPCMPAGDEIGFARPTIRLDPDIFDDRLNTGAKGHGSTARIFTRRETKRIWLTLAHQVRSQGLCLGIAAEVPPRTSSQNF